MMTITDLAKAVGRKNIANKLGVRTTAVSNHVVRGAFPGSWYIAVKELAEASGVPCPDHLFKMQASRAANRKGAA